MCSLETSRVADIEFISGTVKVEESKGVSIASYYRLLNIMDDLNITKTREELSHFLDSRKKNIVLIGGAFNLPETDWNTLQIEGTQYPNKVNETFLDIDDDNNLEHHENIPI